MNCIIIDDDPVQNALIEGYIEEIEGLKCLGTFNNPIEYLKDKRSEKVDFIILDMEMPKMSGVDLLNALTDPISVLVISSKAEYAIEVINHNVLGYLLKPVKFVDFLKTIDKIKGLLNFSSLNTPPTKDDKNHLFIKSNGMLHKLDYSEILYIAASVDYIEVYTKNKKYLVNSTMSNTEDKLPKDTFFRIHRSTIINVNHIKRIDGDFVEINQETLKVAPGKKEAFLNFINSL